VKQFWTSLFVVSVLVTATVACYAQQPKPPEPAPPPPTPGITQVIQPPPLPPPAPEVLQADEGTFGIEPQIWLPQGHPLIDKGAQTTDTSDLSHIVFPGKNKGQLGGMVRVPAGRRNALRVTYLESKSSGTFTAPQSLNLWGGGYNAGDSVLSDYSVRSINVSFDYLTWPYPPRERRFRLKTLWQFEYLNAKSSFLAPTSTNATASSDGSKHIILPSFGLGVTEYLTKNFRVEANGAGFGIPSHSAVANADGGIAYKIGLIELHAGAKYLYFRTTPQSDFYMKGHLAGAYVGVRLAFRP